MQSKNIIYIDESSFHSWINSNKSWSMRGHPNNHVIDDGRFAVTVIGAIGKCLQQPVFELYDKTDEKNFIHFLRLLKSKLPPHIDKPIVFLDNHTAHKTKEVKKLLDRYFIPLMNVPHSCQFNCKLC